MDVDANSSNLPKPHETLWYPDGSVVLATDLYLFKVHKSVLSIHSSVFKDMFELSNDNRQEAGGVGHGEAQETYDGLPLVHLLEDGEDVVHLLRAVYEPRYHDRCSEKTPLDTVVALLLMSTKYDFKNIRNDVIFQISRLYPLEYEEFLLKDSDDYPTFGTGRWDCHFPLLSAAFKTNADVLLPTLYFACSILPMETILDQSSLIPPECLRVLFMGRDELHKSIVSFISQLSLQIRREVDRGVSNCMMERPCLATAIFTASGEFLSSLFDFESGNRIVDWYVTPICDECKRFVGNEADKLRSAKWNDSPAFYGCKDWYVLGRELKMLNESYDETEHASLPDDSNGLQIIPFR